MRYIFILWVFCSQIGFSQAVENISQAAAREDLQFLKQQIEQYQPSLYIYNDQDVFEQLYDSLYQSIEREINILDFHKVLCRLIAACNEGHFGIGSNGDAFIKGFGDNSFHYLPLELYFAKEGVFLVKNGSTDSTLQVGDEILSINGRSIESIKQTILDHLFSDGHITTYSEIPLNYRFSYFYFWFVERPDSFDIEYRRANGEASAKRIRIEAQNREAVRAAFAKYDDEKYKTSKPSIADMYTLEITGKTASLRLKSFDWRLIEKYELKAKSFYTEIFTKLQQAEVQHLIVDLRYNTGGRVEFASEMIPFIMKAERKGVFRESLSWSGKKKTMKLPKKHKLAFTGDIYTLINGRTFSAGATLAGYLKEFGDAILIGEEAGARYEGFAAGSSQTVFLPNTKIKVQIPRYWMKYPSFSKQKTKNRGLIPDYEVSYPFSRMRFYHNDEKELALELIKAKEGK